MTARELEPTTKRGVATRSRGKLLALAAATVVVLYLCYLMVTPFIPPIVWAVTAAVVTHRFSRWVGSRVKTPDRKASICVGVVAVVVLLPAVLVIVVGAQQVAIAVQEWDSITATVAEWVKNHPRLNEVWKDVDLAAEAPGLVERLRPGAVAIASTPLYLLMQTLLTLFVLYFLYRDEDQAIESIRSVLPLSERETDRLFQRVDDTINATIFGTVTVAMVQGIMGGIMFGFLGIQGATLWALIMGLLAIIPYLGTFVVWGPTAAILALQGEWGKAAILVAWGAIAIGLIDNLLYPYLVGQRLRQHTVVSFVAILGGVATFGATGIVLGPVVVTLMFFLLDLWRRRTEHGASAERA
ncbi:AI-2E family transporter [Lacipirellula limnantheis]|uniref:Putative inner membrane protein n=1 Tax=Lacipirellula limnantheis TaxID=2528024 RepID=A0A517TRP3_9BACT|nr:AI-2E family transporter [Lacipirellula limnantheis]QDT71040.1 putative inner membrane protein [Lacipirellula limnantheis]